ncbi:cytochrome P450 [Nocardia transvalensis]|uniref:cytochrome P450 n=1 Tax=Nocardia transvalensis TaxID=37333 RepID=UPI0018946B9B|nr:cytochrome P450 [Nocardia transvalensis]MBF6327069.1 cytochrome P450 [Nocardia transvalensis]
MAALSKTTGASHPAVLHPSRWLPTFIRWHDTRVSWWESWKLAVKTVPRVRDHTITEYATRMPGQDDVMVARIPFLRFVVVRSPELARHVLVTNQNNYAKSAEYDMLAVAFGRGLVTDLDDRRWMRNRRLVQPVFGKRNVDRFAGPMTEAALDAVERIAAAGPDSPVDVNFEMNRLTLDIIARTMFGTDLAGPMAQVRLANLLRFFGVGFMTNLSRPIRAMSTWVLRHGPHPEAADNPRLPMRLMRAAGWLTAPRAMRDLRHVETVIDQLIADHRSGRITRKDNLLALLMDARDPETGYAYTDQEIRDELMTFIGAGMETTATALAWTWHLLGKHPEVRERLYEELDTVLAGRVPTAEDVDRLVWTKAVVSETMRVYPPIIGLARVAVGDDVLGGYPIKAGTTVAVMLHGVHHNDRIWDRPDEFDPTRYLPENLQTPQKQASLPFGAGKRMCVAYGFATMEAVLVLATMAQRLELNPVNDKPIRPQISFTGGPDEPVWMHPTERPARRHHQAV